MSHKPTQWQSQGTDGPLRQKKKVLMERGGVIVVRSVVHDMVNTERLLSKCFSQDPPHKRTSSEQGHHHIKSFGAFKKKKKTAHKTSLYNPQITDRKEQQGHVPCSLPLSSIIGFCGLHAAVWLRMYYLLQRHQRHVEVSAQELQLCYRQPTFSTLQIVLLLG